jgi:8-oxo-dGTP pyrophosphatase MutT (NUDIX family)
MDLESLKVSSTIIVISKDKKALIVQRASDGTFPNLWTVAGGKISDTDGILVSEDFRYFSAEVCAVRELKEETGIHTYVSELKYLCSIYAGAINRLVLSYYVVLDKNADEIAIELTESQDYKWITEEQIDNFKFIPDIGGEIRDVFKKVS